MRIPGKKIEQGIDILKVVGAAVIVANWILGYRDKRNSPTEVVETSED